MDVYGEVRTAVSVVTMITSVIIISATPAYIPVVIIHSYYIIVMHQFAAIVATVVVIPTILAYIVSVSYIIHGIIIL